MLKNLLVVPKKIGLGEAVIDALIGLSVVFLGITLLVLIVALVGKVMTKSVPVKQTKKTETVAQKPTPVVKQESSDDITEETIAVITAAIMAYYEKENRKCEFTVKRIKRI
ncbi:MAG: OadG family protein [Clostridia bacterium]|nr:OadG family protein [Clostridia bacterium]